MCDTLIRCDLVEAQDETRLRPEAGCVTALTRLHDAKSTHCFDLDSSVLPVFAGMGWLPESHPAGLRRK